MNPSPPSIAWLLAVLTVVVMCALFAPSRSKNRYWGRTHTRIPMSAVGAWAFVTVMLLFTVSAFGFLPLWTIFLGIPILLVAALYDSWLAGVRKRNNVRALEKDRK